MEPSYSFPQDDYALAVLTHAAMHTEPTTGALINTASSTSYDNSSSQGDRSTPSSLSRGLLSNQISHDRTSTSSSSPRLSINQQPAHNAILSLSHPLAARRTELLNGYGHGMETLGYPASQQRTHPYMNTSYHGIGSQISSYSTAGVSGLGILNAESYDDGRGRMSLRSLNEKTKSTGQVMPFGVTEASGDITESHEDELERSREKGGKRRKKRAAAEQNVEDAEEEEARKKARGRPRVDTKDETAADRRRTQIRMAQRAYRHRKETTITSLEKQVQDLRGTNEEMSNIFISLYDFAVGKGLLQREPEFGQQLQSTTERFLALAKASSNDDGHDENLGEESKLPDSESGRRSKGKTSPKKQHEEVDPHMTDLVNPWGGYTLSKDDTPDNDLHLDFPQQSYENRGRHSDLQIITRPTEDNASFPFDLMDLQQYRVEVPSIEDFSHNFLPQIQPSLPTTHSYNEFSFARRIQRGAIERAFRLITSTDVSPDLFDRVFGLTLMYETREHLEARLTRAISKTSKDSLHAWRNPFVHIGGSGTFYPDNDSNNDLLRPKFRTGYSMGPFSPSITEADDLMQDDMRCSLPGFEGEFFDANDVEGYLRGRGLDIPPAADFITAELDISVLSESPRSNSSVAALSPKTPESPLTKMIPDPICTPYTFDFSNPEPKAFPFPALKYGTWDSEVHSTDSNVDPNIDPIFNTIPDPNLGRRTPDSAVSEVPFSEKRVVTVNIKTLIDEILRKGVCLGRAPGFRPSDVNAAIVAAVKA